MMLRPEIDADRPDSVEAFSKGDYVENRNGVLVGYHKIDFENRFGPVRAPRQASNGQKRKRRASAATTTTS